MCLYKQDKITKIAKRNILCYKQLLFGTSSYFYAYKYDKMVKQPIVNFQFDQSDLSNGIAVYRGYHSRNNKSSSNKSSLFVIPKGTKYTVGSEYYNSIIQDNYVSETIVYFGKNTFWNRLLAKFKKF